MTPAEHRRIAAQLRAEAARVVEDARQRALRVINMAEMHDRAANELDRLQPPSGPRKIDTMDTQQARSRGAAIAAAKSKARWPLRVALEKRGLSVPEWARMRGYNPNTARSWVNENGGRPIPRAIAEANAREFLDDKGRTEVPAVAASYPHGIRD